MIASKDEDEEPVREAVLKAVLDEDDEVHARACAHTRVVCISHTWGIG